MTVRDPARPAVRFVPVVPDAAAEALTTQRRRWLALVLAVLVAGAAVLVAADVLEQRRLDGVARISLAAPLLPSASWSYDRSTRTATLESALQLRNSGPRPVRVVSARLGRLRFDGDQPMAARTGTATLALRSTVRCPADGSRPPPEPAARTAVVRLVTPTGPREVVLRTRGTSVDSATGAARACGYPPLEEAVRVYGSVESAGTGVLRVRLEITHTSRRRPRLVSLAFARGLDVLRLTGDTRELPVDLGRPALGGLATLQLDVVLGISCGAVTASRGVGLPDVDVLVEDADDGDLAQVTGRLREAEVLRQLVVGRCASG